MSIAFKQPIEIGGHVRISGAGKWAGTYRVIGRDGTKVFLNDDVVLVASLFGWEIDTPDGKAYTPFRIETATKGRAFY